MQRSQPPPQPGLASDRQPEPTAVSQCGTETQRVFPPRDGVDALAAADSSRSARRDSRGHRDRPQAWPMGRHPTPDSLRRRPRIPRASRHPSRRRTRVRRVASCPVLAAPERQDRATTPHDRRRTDRSAAALHRGTAQGQRRSVFAARAADPPAAADPRAGLHRRLQHCHTISARSRSSPTRDGCAPPTRKTSSRPRRQRRSSASATKPRERWAGAKRRPAEKHGRGSCRSPRAARSRTSPPSPERLPKPTPASSVTRRLAICCECSASLIASM
jgi:hypothetical protein